MSIHKKLLTGTVTAAVATIGIVCWGFICLVGWSLTDTPADTLSEYMEEFGEDEGLARWQSETVAGRIAKWRGRS